MFLRFAALFGVADLAGTAVALYGQRELNRGVFKMENIDPKPGKLWERTKYITVEDHALLGGLMGILTAMNPRGLPGVYGMSRFLGAATVGCAFGSQVGNFLVVRHPPQLLSMIDANDAAVRVKAYSKLQNDRDAKASLSLAGRLALKYYTSPFLKPLRFQFGGVAGVGALPGGNQHARPLTQSAHGHRSSSSRQADADKYTVIQIEFKESDLAGPDVEAGYRAYKDDAESWDEKSIREWMERTQDLEKRTAMEMAFVAAHLEKREHEFYLHTQEDREKDILRRELQLLNNMVADLVTRISILMYQQADAQKRLNIIQGKHAGAQIPDEKVQDPSAFVQEGFKGPVIVTELVRTNWTRQKALLNHMENSLWQYDQLPAEERAPFAEHIKQIQQNEVELRKNIEGTERLLRWLEQKVGEFDQQSSPKDNPER